MISQCEFILSSGRFEWQHCSKYQENQPHCSNVNYQPNRSDCDKIVCFVHEINRAARSAKKSVSSQPSTESQEKYIQNEVRRIRDFGLFKRLLHKRPSTKNYQMGHHHHTNIGSKEYCRSTNSISIKKFHLDFPGGMQTEFRKDFTFKINIFTTIFVKERKEIMRLLTFDVSFFFVPGTTNISNPWHPTHWLLNQLHSNILERRHWSTQRYAVR